jgi:hypothetical protein
MSDTSGFTQAYSQASEAFTKFVPGFEFLQGLVKNAGKAMPPMGQWVAPTLDPAELERRIEELKTVQFWLEQNARMIGATIQALEVQRMTLGTLKGMNVSLGDLSEALKMTVPDIFSGAAAAADSSAAKPAKAPAPAPAAPSEASGDEAAASAGPVDAMQWWNSLTQQFTQLAAQAIQATSDAARQASEATSEATSQAVQAASAATAAAAEAAKPMTDAVNEVASQVSKTANAASPAKPRAPAKKKADPAPAAKPAATAAAPKAARRRAR